MLSSVMKTVQDAEIAGSMAGLVPAIDPLECFAMRPRRSNVKSQRTLRLLAAAGSWIPNHLENWSVSVGPLAAAILRFR